MFYLILYSFIYFIIINYDSNYLFKKKKNYFNNNTYVKGVISLRNVRTYPKIILLKKLDKYIF